MRNDFQIDLRRLVDGRLYVKVRGAATYPNTLAYWQAVAEAIEAQPAHELLLVDELVGPPLEAADWQRLVVEVGPRLGALRIAHVKPRGLDTVEHCVLSAMAAGLDARVFEDERLASVWLRYPGDAA